MDETRARGEMPFLDHLEELRWRILWSLIALLAGTVIGFLVVQNFDVLALLKRPIAPFLPNGKLFITRPTDAFIITLKLAALVGIVLAAPIVIWQVWAFFSPALYQREKRFVVPALISGLVLFVVGVSIAYEWVLPAALRILLGTFQRTDLESIITADEYFSFAAQLILAFGVMFELPLVIVLLAAFGLVNPKFFARNRPIALVIAAIISAILTPPDAVSMMMLLIPLMLLYEAGVLIGRLIWKARQQPKIGAVAGLLVLLAVATPGVLHAQRPPRRARPDSSIRAAGQDSLRPRAGPGQGLDTAAARQLGLPTAPTRSFPEADSILRALLADTAYKIVRYAADSVILFADSQAVALVGQGLVEQEGATLEADTVRFRQASCELLARGRPTLFQKGTVLVGHQMRYDTCERRGFVDEALTNFVQSGVDWFLRGGLSVDSASVRLFARNSDLTSCELPIPHYHFRAGSVKWVKNTVLIARPVVLYVQDVPVLWLPFIFQDMRPGRRSGMLAPRFGINDLVRPNQGYARHVTNVGYYFALSDYLDFQASMDWYAGTSVSVNGQFRYRWLDRFLQGGIALTRMWEQGTDAGPGGRSLRLQWRHDQNFNLQTRLAASVDYVTSARVVERNAVDPYLATASLGSNINFSKRFGWGTLSLGGSLRQDLTNGAVTQTLPTLTLSPMPIDIARFITWSPSLTFTNSRAYHQFSGTIAVPPLPGDTTFPLDSILTQNRVSDLQLSTPFRIGGWNWQNSISVHDEMREVRDSVLTVDPNNPGDTTYTFYGQAFQTTLDWNTGFGLPTLFPATWKLQPTIGIQNTTGGAFMVRNRNTNGAFVSQGKRLSFGAGISPSFFGFFPGVGPLARIRHKISPVIRWTFAPAANVPEEYARAIAGPGRTLQLRSPAQHRISFGLTQNFEGKLRLAPGDTATDPANARKVKLLGIQTSDLSYDFEQAKEEGRTGWVTSSISNQFTSDLLPGFSLGITHDLWDGPVGTDSAKFAPFLSRVSARFTVSQRTFSSIVGLITGHGPTPSTGEERPEPLDTAVTPSLIPGPSGDRFQDYDMRPTRGTGKRPLSLSVTYDSQRQRPTGAESPSVPSAFTNNQTLGLSFGFDPTKDWSLSWSTQYNLTTKQFGQHVVRLERDLHRWRATFQFLKSPNGNFAFNFFISLLDQPDIKLQYDQQTLSQSR
jgi:sec-independent protein translocase protein TatC